MIHYTYKIVHINGKYYIGRHSTKILDDGYMGSGKWPLSIKDKHNIKKEILSFCSSLDELKAKEQELLNEHIGNPLCMNFSNRATGWPTGKYNPASRESEKIRKSKQVGELNSMFGKKHSFDSKQKMSESRKGKMTWNKGLTGIKTSDKGQTAWNKGIHTGYKSFTGKTHSAESIAKMKGKHANRQKLTCSHCNKIIDKPNFSRYHGDKCRFKLENPPCQHTSA